MSAPFLQETEPTAMAAQDAVVDEFGYFGDWSERYQYLIDLGKRLPALPNAWKSEKYRVNGCQSLVWLVARGDERRLEFAAGSDSSIVAGLVYLALRVFSGRSAAEILATETDYISRVGLAKHLSPTRSNGLAAVLGLIRQAARDAADGKTLVAPQIG